MSRPFRVFAFRVISDPGRCPGLVCHAPAGLIPTSPIDPLCLFVYPFGLFIATESWKELHQICC